jgi:cytochrome b561
MILVLLVHGWWMTHMILRPERLANYAWHSALGYDLLALLVLRLLWRWVNLVPPLPADLRPWERKAALTGWVVATTFRVPMTKDLFGIDVPPIVTSVDRSVRQWVEESHMVLAYLLAAVVLVHIVGALRHHFLKRNNLLIRMVWSARAPHQPSRAGSSY